MAQTEQTETNLLEVLAHIPPPLPPRESKVGASTVQWWEGRPGDAVVIAEGGTIDDRYIAEQVTAAELAIHGYRRAQFTFDARHKTAGWIDIMNKAKRLIQSGNVTVLRNGYNNLVGHVIGDHGEYTTEIGRDDPSSRAITTWTCECPWDQYAWQRTRKWKKYEGRPCAHVLALYWKALSTPLDEDVPESMGPDPGQKQGPPVPPEGGPGPGAPMGPSKIPSVAPAAPVPTGGPAIPAPPGPPSLPGPPSIPGMAPPGSPDVLPPSPTDQLAMMQPPLPGATPSGQPANPNVVSVPGAKIPGPFNPIQYPGGTYSAQEPDLRWLRGGCADFARALQDAASEDGEELRLGVHRSPLGIEHVFAHNDTHAFDAYGQHPLPYMPHPGMANAAQSNDEYDVDPMEIEEHAFTYLPDEERIQEAYPEAFNIWSTRRTGRVSAEFNAPEIVRLKDDGYGTAEGKDPAAGAGQYRNVPAGSTGEVMGQDEATGWVEVIFPLHETGENEPYLVRMFCEPAQIEKTRMRPPGEFIRRRR
jgi:hypothetical protein